MTDKASFCQWIIVGEGNRMMDSPEYLQCENKKEAKKKFIEILEHWEKNKDSYACQPFICKRVFASFSIAPNKSLNS